MADGDEAAFDAFFRDEYPRLFRRVLFVVGDPAAADDVVQEALARAWARWRRVGAMERPGAWTQRVAVRAAIRHRATRPAWAELAEPAAGLAESNGPSDPGSLDRRLLAAIAALAPRQRAAFVLHVFDELDAREIGGVLGCAEATARVHLHRARTQLARTLGDLDPRPEVLDGA